MEFIPIRSFDNYISANLVLSRLLNEGINCYLKDENTITIFPVLGNAIGGIKICVVDDDVQRATELLNQFDEDEKISCPKCSSKNYHLEVQTNNTSNWILATLSWALTSFALKGKQVYHCYNCSYESDKL